MIDTRVAGSPADIARSASFLRGRLGAATTRATDEVLAQRAVLERAWDGEAGSAFRERASGLVRSGDDCAVVAAALADRLDTLATVLRDVQQGMAAVRRDAAAAGLLVEGERVLPATAPAPGPEAAYQRVRQRRDELVETWVSALADAQAAVEDNATSLSQATLDLMVTGYRAKLLRRTAAVMTGQAAWKLEEWRALISRREALHDLLRSGRITPTRAHTAEWERLRLAEHDAEAAFRRAEALAAEPRLPLALRGGLGMLGPLAAGYGVYADIEHGESVEQAVASQGGGLVVGTGAGAVAGSVIGSATVPIVGTLAGCVFGAGIGAVASRVIDDHYEDEEAEREAAAAAERDRDEQRVHNILNLEQGVPPYSAAENAGELWRPEDWGWR